MAGSKKVDGSPFSLSHLSKSRRKSGASAGGMPVCGITLVSRESSRVGEAASSDGLAGWTICDKASWEGSYGLVGSNAASGNEGGCCR